MRSVRRLYMYVNFLTLFKPSVPRFWKVDAIGLLTPDTADDDTSRQTAGQGVVGDGRSSGVTPCKP